MKKVEKMVCWICNNEHDSATAAKECEAKGLMTPYFKIGDTVQYQAWLGSDRDGSYHEKQTGTVIDILFPVSPKHYRAGHILGHRYQVSYLVRVVERESKSEDQFFNQENIKLLQTLKTVEVVGEAAMFFEDGAYIDGALNTNMRRSRRTIVTSWADYVADVIRRNPQLKNRLVALTARFRSSNSID